MGAIFKADIVVSGKRIVWKSQENAATTNIGSLESKSHDAFTHFIMVITF